jgi:hypothetical protein
MERNRAIFIERKISLDEFKSILLKMEFYNIKVGYIGIVKGKAELFLQQCAKATAEVTIDEIRDAIKDYQ